jgi:adenylate kinase family enzyme
MSATVLQVRKRDNEFRSYIKDISPYFESFKKTIDGSRDVDKVYADVKKAIFG